ncbi:hypothetical protein GQ596_03410 [Gilliamella sp. Pra-s60]|uniref:hypothetical protein n=1 Tax=Gilliamella sp. Pra-s60 TaxID=2687315 RepID=UPI00132C41BA|nr:hypothetical protein [Gilliamella sp. Pra-s60]MWN31494.1 hypothetical protein [Gilliamella sp. Pra-s60]
MKIEEKLALSETPISLLKEGLFLKAYNQSFYVLNQLLGFNLKPLIDHVKKLDRVIIHGGFPVSVINKRVPNAVLTVYGYKLLGDYDLSGYQAWYQQQCHLYQKRKAQQNQPQQTTTHTNEVTAPQSSIFTDSEPIAETALSNINKTLTLQHLLFLSSWQPNKYPPIVDSAFIQELKNYFSQ